MRRTYWERRCVRSKAAAKGCGDTGIAATITHVSGEPAAIKLPRFFLRLAAGGAMLVVVVFAALVLWLRYVALPDVDSYRARIVAALEKSSGMAVSVRSLDATWGGLR